MSVIKLTQPQQERLRRLLHMEYTVTEISQELGCRRRAIERAIEVGAPHHRNKRGTIYVVGDAFAEWWRSHIPQKKTLADDEAYCLHCRGARKFTVDKVYPNSPGVERIVGTCLTCGSTIYRLRKAVQQ